MSKNNTSTYAAASMPFEQRCANAKEGLVSLKLLLASMSDKGLHRREKDAQDRARSLGAMSPEGRELCEQFDRDLLSSFHSFEEEHLRSIWDSGVKLETSVWGADAVQFALKAIERETKAS